MRIMTTNIWGDYFGNPVDVREKNVFEVYKNYAPDVIGLQEITDGWYKSNLFKWMSEDYFFVGTELCDNINYVPMAIKKGYEVVAKGYEMLAETPDASKAITWAVLKDKDGKVFGVCNTHFWWMAGKEEHDILRAKNALQLSDLVRSIGRRFSCPVFAFGDMNCKRSSQAFGVVCVVAGFRHLYDLTENRDNICTIHGNPVVDSEGYYHGQKPIMDQSASIDHIIAVGESFKVLQYRVVTDGYALDATDHSPVYADIELL